jgi:N-acetylglucosaminylphosphatidylinositol deacetylase
MPDWLDFLYYFKWYLIAVQIFIILLAALFFSSKEFSKELKGKRIMIVTAHPDDEVMFFTPFINYFKHFDISLLCLSNGNAEGLGKVREKELEKACKYLGVKRFEVFDSPLLPDGMDKHWDPEEIIKVITKYIEKYQIDCIFTFDKHGVSGHTNHISIRSAVSILKSSKTPLVSNISYWELESTGILRKYIGILDIVFSSQSSAAIFNPNPLLVWNSMSIHSSQFVWYRKLFVVFSRYAYFNTFQKI